MSVSIVVTPSDPESLRKTLIILRNQPFSFSYLGQVMGESVRISEYFAGKGQNIDSSTVFHKAADELRGSYLEYLALIGNENPNLRWWLSHLSYKSCYISKAFHGICLLKTAIQLVDDWAGDHTLVLVVSKEYVRRAIKDNLVSVQERNILFIKSNSSFFIKNILKLGEMLSHRLFFVLRESKKVVLARRLVSNSYVPHDSITLLISSLTFRNLHLGEDYHKTFFGHLVQQLKRLGNDIALVPFIQRNVDFRDAIEAINRYETPSMVIYKYLTIWDIVRIALFTVSKPPPKHVQSFCNMDIEGIIREDQLNSWVSNWSSDALIMESLARRLSKSRIRITSIIYVYENQPWERAMCWGIRKYFPDTILFGYQHSRTPNMLLNFYMAPEDILRAPLPDYIVSVGLYTAGLLSEAGYRPEQIRLGGALQMQSLVDRRDTLLETNSANQKMILIACSNGPEESAELCNVGINLALEHPDIEIVIKCHPITPYDRFAQLIGDSLPNNVNVSTDPINDLMIKSWLMLYSGSTVCIEALILELPMIHYKPCMDFNLDPLERLPQVRLEATRFEDINNQVSWLLEHRDYYIAEHKELWRNAVTTLYQPVTDQTFLAFTE